MFWSMLIDQGLCNLTRTLVCDVSRVRRLTYIFCAPLFLCHFVYAPVYLAPPLSLPLLTSFLTRVLESPRLRVLRVFLSPPIRYPS